METFVHIDAAGGGSDSKAIPKKILDLSAVTKKKKTDERQKTIVINKSTEPLTLLPIQDPNRLIDLSHIKKISEVDTVDRNPMVEETEVLSVDEEVICCYAVYMNTEFVFYTSE